MTWTGERVATLKQLWTGGHSASVIAARLGEVTRNAVIGKVHRLGLAGRKTGARKKTAPAAGFPFGGRSRCRTPSQLSSLLQARRHRMVRPAQKVLPEPGPAPDYAVTVHTLAPQHCRWPIGDPKLDGFHFCGRTRTRSAIPYCDHHAAIAYN